MRIILWILACYLVLLPPTAFAASIKINEFYAAGSSSSNPDWVEIYNEGFDISLYQLIDAANNKKDLASATCSGNFCTIDWYNTLNNSGDTIKLVLKSAPDSALDQVIYSGDVAVPNSNQSAGRNPDASGTWAILSSPTKGSANAPSLPDPTPTPSLTTTPLSSISPSSFFTTSNIPSQINSNQSFNISINLSLPDNPGTIFYLKGAFKKIDGSNYFGQTKVSGNWVKNGSSFSSQYQITTDSSGNWSGNLEIQPDAEDSGFTGTGDYIFKVGRYTSSGSGPSWSSESTIKIIASENTSTKTTTSESNSVVSPSVETLTKTTSSPIAKTYVKLAYRQASIAGAKAITSASALPSPQTTVKTQKQVNPLMCAGLSLILLGSGSVGYIYYKNGKIHF